MRLFLQNTFATSWCLTHSPNHPATPVSQHWRSLTHSLSPEPDTAPPRGTAARTWNDAEQMGSYQTGGFFLLRFRFMWSIVLIHAWKVVEGLGGAGDCSPGCPPSLWVQESLDSAWKAAHPLTHLPPLLPSWSDCRDDGTCPPETSPYLQGCTAIHHLYLSPLLCKISCPGPTLLGDNRQSQMRHKCHWHSSASSIQ